MCKLHLARLDYTAYMRLAVMGKGGAGKSVIAGTLARLRARDGRQVLAVDMDVNPGLAVSLGIPVTDDGLPDDAVQPAPPDIPYGFDIRSELSPKEAVARYARQAPDDVRFLQIGNIGRVDHGLQRFVVVIRRILRGFREPGWDVVADLEAGPTTVYEGYADFADTALIVVEPSWASALAARRIASVVRDGGPPAAIIGNKVRTQEDAAGIEALGASLGLPVLGMIPFDAAVAKADREGRAPLEASPDGPGMESLRVIARAL